MVGGALVLAVPLVVACARTPLEVGEWAEDFSGAGSVNGGATSGGTTSAGSPSAVPGLANSCEPTLFAQAIQYPMRVALTEQQVFWTSYGDCPLSLADQTGDGMLFGARRVDGGSTLVIANLPCPSGVTAIDDDLYWSNQPGALGGAIWAAKQDGQQLRVLANGLHFPSTVRADASHVYWFDVDGVYRVPRQGGQTELFAAIHLLDSGVRNAFALDDRYAYWIDELSFDESGVFRAEKASGIPERLAVIEQPLDLTLTAAGLFWVEARGFQQFSVLLLPWAQQTPITLAETPWRPRALAAFDNQAYWVDGDGPTLGSVYRARPGQSEPTVIADSQPEPVSIAVDAEYVFWINMNNSENLGGHVMRACRP